MKRILTTAALAAALAAGGSWFLNPTAQPPMALPRRRTQPLPR